MEQFKSLKPAKITDIIFRLDEYIEAMRVSSKDAIMLVDLLELYVKDYFLSADGNSLDMKKMAVEMTDEMYVKVGTLRIRDKHTDAYFEIIVYRLFFELQKIGIRMFFILDNQLRDDRFKGVTELFTTGFFSTIHPYEINPEYYGEFNTPVPCKPYESVEKQIIKSISEKRHIFYVEKDDSVNYLKNVLAIAEEVQNQYVCAFRNLSADTHNAATWLLGSFSDII